MRVAGLLLLVVAGALAAPLAAAPAPVARLALVPLVAPADGGPFAVVVEAVGTAGLDVEAKAWIGTPTTVASSSFDGLAWVHSSRYVARGTIGADGTWRATVAVSADSPAGNSTVLARVRAGDALSPVVEAPIRLVPRAALAPAWSHDALAVAREPGGAVAALGTAAPDPSGASTPRARVLAPAGTHVANATAPPTARFLAVGAGEATIEVGNATRVCLIQKEAVCGDVSSGSSTLALASTAPVSLAVWGEVVETIDPPASGALRLEDGVWRARPAGFVARAAPPSETARVFAFAYPESGLWAFERVAGAAVASLDGWVYEIKSEDAAARLAQAAARGVRVRLLAEGAPVGGIDPEEARLLSGLAAAGVEVRLVQTNGSVGARYPNVHAKVLVADASVVMLGSENWNEGAMGLRGEAGNRGWGLVAEAPATAGWLAGAFEHDWTGRDAVPWASAGGARPLPSGAAATFRGVEVAEARMGAMLAPDAALPALLALVTSANRTIDVQQLFVEPAWNDGASPLVDALLAAAARGVRVRLHLDGSVRTDADGVAAAILARAGSLPLEVRVDASGRTIHNKGLVVDGERVLVSSINWGETSVTRNREAGIVVDDARVAGWFRAKFEEDWSGRPRADVERGPGMAIPAAGWIPVVAAALAVAGVKGMAGGSSVREGQARVPGKVGPQRFCPAGHDERPGSLP